MQNVKTITKQNKNIANYIYNYCCKCMQACVCVCVSVCAGGFSLPLFIVFPHSDIVQFIYIVHTVECTRSVADNVKS